MGNDDDAPDDDVPLESILLGLSGEPGPKHETQRRIVHNLVHDLERYAVALVTVDAEGTHAATCISGDVPNELDAVVISHLAAGMRRTADEIEAWVRAKRDGGKH